MLRINFLGLPYLHEMPLVFEEVYKLMACIVEELIVHFNVLSVNVRHY